MSTLPHDVLLVCKRTLATAPIAKALSVLGRFERSNIAGRMSLADHRRLRQA
ncbi:hypothetical protein [Mesorhizobium atlanticum]|jgi:hypothetical protein|uniref:hypothetical protein n=1 Tax=Mesorhizobium atlanticum TaxID=2233532 RepID=UPI0015EC9CF3|nr:hypothetical protein [Mesorhizobium atlanticum]